MSSLPPRNQKKPGQGMMDFGRKTKQTGKEITGVVYGSVFGLILIGLAVWWLWKG
jgi:hypothetical protein